MQICNSYVTPSRISSVIKGYHSVGTKLTHISLTISDISGTCAQSNHQLLQLVLRQHDNMRITVLKPKSTLYILERQYCVLCHT